MKKTKITKVEADELQPEYSFDYSKSMPNRFAGRIVDPRTVILLDPDLAKVFTTSEAVNTALRALLSAVPPKTKRTSVIRSS